MFRKFIGVLTLVCVLIMTPMLVNACDACYNHLADSAVDTIDDENIIGIRFRSAFSASTDEELEYHLEQLLADLLLML
jgi:hypothetical protein